MIDVNKSTACRAIRRVSLALSQVSDRYIHMPHDPRVLARSRAETYVIAQFLRVIACVDGTHVRISAPSTNEWEYVTRKRYHSINVQSMCDANLLIWNAVIRWPESTHDARILNESRFCEFMNGNHDSNIILGDGGYSLKQWLMVPFLNPREDSERLYSQSHMITRSTIERCNGVLKRRFFCSSSGIRMSPDRACVVIRAALVMHNRCVRLGYALGDAAHSPQDVLGEDPGNQAPQELTGKIARRVLLTTHFVHRD